MTSLGVTTALLFSLVALSAQAEPGGPDPTASSQAEADKLISQGLELRRAGKSHEAVDRFRRAHTLAFTPRALGQLALAEASAQIWVDAETHLVSTLELGTDAWVERNRQMIEEALAVVRQHIGELAITGPARTAINVDGRAAGTLPLVNPLRVPEGSALVAATSANFQQFSKTVAIQPGKRVTLAIVFGPLQPRPAVAVAPPMTLVGSATMPGPANRSVWAGGALVAAGAGLATWGAIWIALDDDKAGARFNCGPMCTRVYDTRSWGWGLAAGGVAVTAGGVALLISGRHREPSVALGVTPSAVALSGRF
jgi:hypothetical protein